MVLLSSRLLLFARSPIIKTLCNLVRLSTHAQHSKKKELEDQKQKLSSVLTVFAFVRAQPSAVYTFLLCARSQDQ